METMGKGKKRNFICIISHDIFTSSYKDFMFLPKREVQKPGESIEKSLNRMVSEFGDLPPYNLHYIIYLDNTKILRSNIKEKYKNQLLNDWIKGEDVVKIIKFIRKFCKMLEIKYEDYEYIDYKIK